MAKFVIAGCAGWTSYARLEMLADTLAACLPQFNVRKIVKSTEDWPSWLAAECKVRGWSHNEECPLVWRELVDTGGRGLYLGDLHDFESYTKQYYNIIPSTSPQLEGFIAAENSAAFQKMRQKELDRVPEKPVKICISNGNSALAYHLSHLLGTGALLGTQRIALHFYMPTEDECFKSLAMELQDLASPQIVYVKTTTSLNEAMEGAGWVFLLDWTYNLANLYLFSPEGEEHLGQIAKLYSNYAQAIHAQASTTVKVIVTGCFANVGAALMAATISDLSSSLIAAPSLAESQAKSLISQRLKTHSHNISQVAIWGYTHGQVLADLSFTLVRHFTGSIMGPDPFSLPLSCCEFDSKWLMEEFPTFMVQRHEKLEGYCGQGPAMAEAVCLVKLGRRWAASLEKTEMRGKEDCIEDQESEEKQKWKEYVQEGAEWCSVGIVSKGEDSCYSVPQGLVAALPCQCVHGVWQAVPNLHVPQHIKDGLTKQVKLLQQQLDKARHTITTESSTSSMTV